MDEVIRIAYIHIYNNRIYSKTHWHISFKPILIFKKPKQNEQEELKRHMDFWWT